VGSQVPGDGGLEPPTVTAAPAGATVEVAVARVLRAHGVRGHLVVVPLTDEPEQRLAAGCVLTLETPRPGAPASLAVLRSAELGDRVLLAVAEVIDRDAAEALKGAVLTATLPADRAPADPEEFYDHQLVGLTVLDRAGTALGTVSAVHHGPQDLLVVATGRGAPVLVPFVAALVPEVDPAAGRVVVAPPPGLFDDPAALDDRAALDDTEPTRDGPAAGPGGLAPTP